ncbi:MAG: DUF4252 domain-containing protein, partial [Flavobacteriaceae bacterium]|nr:DUF4252 domain-containing protein [Flavobacteriaceae bacterium]
MDKTIKFLVLLTLIINVSCASTSSFNQFYDQHKNDNNVSSFQVPGYLKSILKNSSPEMNSLLKNVKDFKTISFSNCTPEQSEKITNDINQITKNFTDIVRDNKENKKTLVSVKEKGDKIKEIIIHNNTNNNHKILFLKGNFDPNRISDLTNSNELFDIQ